MRYGSGWLSRHACAAGGLLLGLLAAATLTSGVTSAADTDARLPFASWLQDVRSEAIERGISPRIVQEALGDVEPVARILELDRSQAESRLDLDRYLSRRVTPQAVWLARRQLTAQRPLLDRVERAYGVQPRFIVAIWGLESSFGHLSGAHPVVPTLATLAYDPRRSALFRRELFAALEIVDRGDIDLARMRGSWAGAMGQPQFLPTSFLAYAQDFDNDGRKDIWSSPPDIFASIAYYLQSHGWSSDQTWGRRVHVPDAARTAAREAAPLREAGCRADREMSTPLHLSVWDEIGVRRADRTRLPQADLEASLVTIEGHGSYLVYGNYEAMLRYNCAHAYALSVGLLADRAVGR